MSGDEIGRRGVHNLIISGSPARLAEVGQLPNPVIVSVLTLSGHIVNLLTLFHPKWVCKLT
jgi:hypothetical protein